MENTSCCNLNEDILREVTVKIGLERTNTQEEITVKVKIERLIYIKSIDGIFNKKRLIEHTVEINIFYKEQRKRIEIDVIGE